MRSIISPNHPTRKLGKLAPRLDHRTFKLARYLRPGVLPPIPSEVSWVTRVPQWPMYLNDQLGDCVAAAAGHMINQWTYYATGTETLVTDRDILKTYEDVGGYVPGNPATDNGMDMLTYLNYWRQVGVGGHKILAYMAVDITNLQEAFAGIYLFGNIYLGIQLPLSAQGQDAWTVPDGGPTGNGSPGSWGGHCIPVDAASIMSRTLITWGGRLKMSPNFMLDYADEAYVVLSKDWMEATGLSPSHLNLTQLEIDLKQL